MNTPAKILNYIEKKGRWKDLLYTFREIILSTGLEEKVKWGMPVYCLDNKNIVGLGAFKEYAGLWFFQGSFLTDPQNVLINAQEGKTKGMRHWKFFDEKEEIDQKMIREYVLEAIQNQRDGKEIKAKSRKIVVPDELAKALHDDQLLEMKFKKLSLGKQKDYFEYIGSAKRAETRQRRLDKSIRLILKGKGLNDKYKK